MFKNPFSEPGNWYKANLHTHTAESDGQTPVPVRIEQYRRRGYSVLAITDHDRIVDVSGLSTDDFLLMQGTEVGSPGVREGHRFHLLSLNLPADFDCGGDDSVPANEFVARVREAGGVVFLAHPYWSAVNLEDMKGLKGYAGIEVWNSSQWGSGHSTASVHWDIALDGGLAVSAIAADDTHSAPEGDWDLCAGWTWLKMPELSVSAVVKALRTGCFYASTGPKIYDFHLDGNTVRARSSEARCLRFMGWGPNGQRVWDRDGARGGLVSEGEVEIRNREWWRWVRLEVEDDQGRTAWANPIILNPEMFAERDQA